MHANIARIVRVVSRIFALSCIALSCAFLAPRAYAQSVNLSALTKLSGAQAGIVATYKSYNRGTKETVYGLSFTNSSGAALHGPVYVTIEGLSPAATSAALTR